MVPDRIIHPKPDKPAEQKIELHPLHQLPLGADAVERLQQHRPKQLLRRDRGAAEVRIKRREIPRQIAQRRVRDLPDHPQRMIAPNPGLKIHIAEKRSRPIVTNPASHLPS